MGGPNYESVVPPTFLSGTSECVTANCCQKISLAQASLTLTFPHLSHRLTPLQ